MNHSPRHGNELLFEEDLLCLLFSVAFFLKKKTFLFMGWDLGLGLGFLGPLYIFCLLHGLIMMATKI